jgi:penicillin-binding protein 1A
MGAPFLNTNSMGPMPKQPSDVAQVGDLIRLQRKPMAPKFSQVPQAQGALVSLDPQNGAIRALVGGFAFEQSNYNRATRPSASRARASSRSSTAPLDNGYTAASLVNDAPIVFVDEYLDKVWRPKNDTNTFLGPIRCAKRCTSRVTWCRSACCRRWASAAPSTTSPVRLQQAGPAAQPVAGLGTATLTPMEIATGWSTFANGGYKITPYLIDKIESRNGETLFVANPPSVPKNASKDGLPRPPR